MKKAQIRQTAKIILKNLEKTDFYTIARYIEKTFNYNVYVKTSNSSSTAAYTNHEEKFIFINRNLEEKYATKLLIHEMAHIALKHSVTFSGDNILKENEANYFVQYFLNYKKYRKIYAITFLIICLLIIMSLLSFKFYKPTSNENINHNTTETVNQSTNIINDSENVVITHSGEKYHLPTCYHVRDKSDTITLTKQEAEKANYTACKICIGE